MVQRSAIWNVIWILHKPMHYPAHTASPHPVLCKSQFGSESDVYESTVLEAERDLRVVSIFLTSSVRTSSVLGGELANVWTVCSCSVRDANEWSKLSRALLSSRENKCDRRRWTILSEEGLSFGSESQHSSMILQRRTSRPRTLANSCEGRGGLLPSKVTAIIMR